MTQTADGQLVSALRGGQAILIFTGAGISTGSGIPDYRGPQGVWKTKQPVYYQDFMSSEAARIEYWGQRVDDWEAFHDAAPNPVHQAVAALEEAGKLVMCVTQNIDGLHSKAGTTEQRLVELHGTNRVVECQSCHGRSDPRPHLEAFRKTGQPPQCSCGGWLKPATISFGQSLRSDDLERAAEAAMSCDLVVSMGSTLSVYPAASVPLTAAQRGVPYVIINRGETDHDPMSVVTLRLEGDVEAIFAPAVAEALAAP
jgi:NAD-dependent deacetylase